MKHGPETAAATGLVYYLLEALEMRKQSHIQREFGAPACTDLG